MWPHAGDVRHGWSDGGKAAPGPVGSLTERREMRQLEGQNTESRLGRGRYATKRVLGQGGMATVWEAVDTVTGERVALKRLRSPEDPVSADRFTRLFEREYYTLSQLEHPRVVKVHDYGVDSEGAYYTMELLDGGSLHDLGRTDWRRASALMIDVCSALALVHSRRLVHRDLSPYNIHCTRSGLAKVIDFGALAPMGAAQELVGTPPFCAPEALWMQPLDARSDLYSLGATLYYALLGRHVYPAKNFRQLRALAGTTVQRPQRIDPDLPKALDDLVMQMLHPDPALRPDSAAEVMERLGAIADIEVDKQLHVSRAYLSTPSLVGRDDPLQCVTDAVDRTLQREGVAILAKGAPGVGRSRFLDTCILNAKLRGLLTLRAGRDLGRMSDYTVVRSLGLQLFDAVPDAARAAAEPFASTLAHVFPELGTGSSGATTDPTDLRPVLQSALRAWFTRMSHHAPLFLAVDDVDSADEPSAAFVALLAHELSRHPIALVATSTLEPSPEMAPAMHLLEERSTALELAPFGPDDTLALLRSVFGPVPHIELVAHHIHQVAAGNADAILKLAQHLVDQGLARYQGGAWSLPDEFDPADLPGDMAEAMRVRVAALAAGPLELAGAMALRPDRGLTFEQCLHVTEGQAPGQLVRSLEELIQAGMVQKVADRYVLAQPGWVPPVRESLAPARARRLHLGLAECFDSDLDGFMVAQHLLLAGERDRGLSALVHYSEASMAVTEQNPEAYFALIRSLPPDWFATFANAIELAEQLRRPKRDLYLLRSRLAGLTATQAIDHPPTLSGLMNQLYHDAGLDLYETLAAELDPQVRLRQAFELAQKRYDEAPDSEKVCAPREALPPLVRATVKCIAPMVFMQDYSRWEMFPSVGPLVRLSPAVWVVEQLRIGLGYRISGQLEKARAIYLELLNRISEPDSAGLEPTYHRHVRCPILRMLGSIDACWGLDSALDWAAKLEKDPFYQSSGLFVRMLYHLWQGDGEKADECQRRVDRLNIQNGPPLVYNVHLYFEIAAHAVTDDLARIKRSLAQSEDLARRYPGWVPVAHFARASYNRIRGDLDVALSEITQALAQVGPGRHQVWPDAARTHVEVLVGLHRYSEAQQHAEQYLALARSLGMQHAAHRIQLPLAVAYARLGEGKRAVETCKDCVEFLHAIGATGTGLGLAHYAWAQVEAALGDELGFAEQASLCEAEFRKGSTHSLTAKIDRLRHDAKTLPDSTERQAAPNSETARLLATLSRDDSPTARAQSVLSLLLGESGAQTGYLFTLQERGIHFVASVGHAGPLDEAMEPRVNAYLAEILRRSPTLTASGGELSTLDAAWTGAEGRAYCPCFLEHLTSAGFAITAIAVLVANDGEVIALRSDLPSKLSRCLAELGDARPRLIGTPATAT